MREPLQSILADDYLGDVTALTMDEIRTHRNVCTRVETGLSYLRRLAQGRLDVVAAEQARRVDGGSAEDLEGLMARLPALLAGSTRSPGSGRLPAEFGTGTVDEDLAAELEAIVSERNLDDPGDAADDALVAAVGALEAFERTVSDLRRTLFDRIDALEGELTRRYRTGEASVDTLLG